MSILEAQQKSVSCWLKVNTSRSPNTELTLKELYDAYINSLLKESSSIVAPAPRTFSKFVKNTLKEDLDQLIVRYYYKPKSTIKGLSFK